MRDIEWGGTHALVRTRVNCAAPALRPSSLPSPLPIFLYSIPPIPLSPSSNIYMLSFSFFFFLFSLFSPLFSPPAHEEKGRAAVRRCSCSSSLALIPLLPLPPSFNMSQPPKLSVRQKKSIFIYLSSPSFTPLPFLLLLRTPFYLIDCHLPLLSILHNHLYRLYKFHSIYYTTLSLHSFPRTPCYLVLSLLGIPIIFNQINIIYLFILYIYHIYYL